METLIENKKIAVIGGGPVGLTTARLLQMKDADVTVYERDAHAGARMLGGTLDIHSDTGQKAIKAAGLLEELYSMSRPTPERMGDKDGNILMETFPPADDLYSRPEIDRPDLRNLLLNSLKKNTVAWDAHALGITEENGKFRIEFQSGKTAIADLVIIADGSMSKARNFITDSIPAATGTFCIEGEVFFPETDTPLLYKMVNNGNLAVVQDKKTLFIHTKGNGHFNYYASFREPDNWQKDNAVDFHNNATVEKFLNKLFADWNVVFKDLFRVTNEYRGFPLRVFSDFESWKPHTNITLAGDAAHVMPPFGGLGVNLGLLDALNLTENLTNGQFPDIKTALEDYETKMIAYLNPILSDAAGADERIHTQTSTPEERRKRMEKMREKLAQKH